MNKKLLAAAVAAAVVAAPAAFAESTVYGKIHTSVDGNDYEKNGPRATSDKDYDNWEVNNRASRLGFKGSEDLGNGLKAIYQIEFGIRSDGGQEQNVGDGHTSLRNTFLGLAGNWGTAVVGRHDTPMKMAFYAAGTEIIGDSAIDLNPGRNNPIGVFQEFRANNAIAYISPNFSGFTVAAAVIPGEESGIRGSTTTRTEFTNLPGVTTAKVTNTGARNNLNGIADHYSLGAMYKGNGLRAGVGYELLAGQDQGNSAAARAAYSDMKTWQAGASYTMNNFRFGGHYQSTDGFGMVDKADYRAWALTGKATFGNNAVGLVYTNSKLDPSGKSSDVDTNGWGISGEHNFSKRTKVYAAYADNKTDPKATDEKSSKQKTFSLGMIHNF